MDTISLTIRLTIYILAGFAAVRTHIVSKDFSKQLSSLMLTICLPCLILRSFYNTALTSEAIAQFGSMLAATAVTLAVLFVIGVLAKKLLRVKSESKIAVYAMLTSNFTFFGMPLVESLFGAEGLFYYTIFTTLARVVYYACPPYMLGDNASGSVKDFLKQMFSPTIIAVCIGFVMYFLQIKPPEILDSAIQGLASTSTPFGMMLCGMTLADASLREVFRTPSLFLMSLARLVICPALVLLSCAALGFPPLIVKLAVVYAAMPFGALMPTFATKYCSDPHSAIYGSALVTLSTILCIVTVPLWIYIFNTVL